MKDEQIIELFFSRSEQAIEETTLKYGRLAKSVSFRIVRNEEDADECVSDTYLALWNTIPPQKPDPFIAYICKLVRNISLKKYRFNTAEKRNGLYDVSLNELEECLKGRSDVQKELEAGEAERLINTFLGTLKQIDRVIFIKRFWFNMSIDEISDETGCTKNYINVHLHRTKERLKDHLIKEGYYE
ncbi:MAG: sigma-70 family RNA polymerase sigma factor [Clostridiales bacterium]|nr:sigma-70 family RNA polymerase sigma factor [Clostridiales bacterium]